ncbi:MAG: 16S rRNA (uracil(1498)-N(3))-methyltransferase [Eubacterium sp.]|nr:16S rRNA (uracil(1498)-N(3))-methyltransferase [Eubacterium sp.]
MNDIERWRLPRFFSNDIDESEIAVNDEDSKHITSVLRMRAGEKAVICDGNGTDYLCELISAGQRENARFNIIESRQNAAEPDVEVTLYQAMPKSDKLEFIVQKATELGAARIVPFLSKRCVSRPDDKSAAKKLVRLQRIAYEAAKQCGRGKIPDVLPMTDFKSAVTGIADDETAIMFYECGGEKFNALTFPKKKIAVFIGSEGGFEPEEAQLAEEHGVTLVSLGERILRCETAPVTALSLLMNVTGNL